MDYRGQRVEPSIMSEYEQCKVLVGKADSEYFNSYYNNVPPFSVTEGQDNGCPREEKSTY